MACLRKELGKDVREKNTQIKRKYGEMDKLRIVYERVSTMILFLKHSYNGINKLASCDSKGRE